MTWQTDLIKLYPHLFRSEFSERASGYPEVGDGWQAIVERAIERIDAAVGDLLRDAKAVVCIKEIKEKLGGLRIHADATVLPPEIEARFQDAIDLAEARSYCTCEICGSMGRLHDDNGWFTTRCDRHAAGEPIEPKRGEPDLHIKYTLTGGKMRVIRCRSYDRKRDAFVDAPLPSGETWAEEK